MASAAISTRDRVLGAALDRFGTRGVEAVSLDEIAADVGVRKQTVLYWFASKDELVDAVLEATAAEIAVVIEAALKAAPDDPLERVDAVVRAAFGLAVRRPALLGLVRELSRLPPPQAERLRAHVDPLIDRAVAYLGAEMDAGRLRRGDPRLVAAIAYGTVTGIATEPEALRGVGWTPSAAGLRRLRAELRAFLRAALQLAVIGSAFRAAASAEMSVLGVAAAAAVALDGQLDEPVDELRVGDAGRLPQLRVHRDRREPGHRVGLVAEEPAAALLEEEVDAGEPVAAQDLGTRAPPAPAPRRSAPASAGPGSAAGRRR